jgi:hypothetical protein
MRQALRIHPGSTCAAAAGIDVDVERPRAGLLRLGYEVSGAVGDLFLPEKTAPVRSVELWRRTCFEAFVGAGPGGAYVELNFAPSTQWAAYGFSGYRAEMRIAREIDQPAIEVRRTSERFDLRVSIDLGPVADLPGDADWRIGLAAVIEETNGGKSYWALAHPPGAPDFHHAHGFAYELPMAPGA